MTLLELVHTRPDWFGALEVAISRPAGVPERRNGEDPWSPPDELDRPRRVSDDLAWLRAAVDEPEQHGLKPLDDTAAVAVWEAPDDDERLRRLRDRGVLEAAGFLVHEPDEALT
ncbi:MAG TPA: hypothetical protein VM266_06130 [Solirubrobacteraceae bacterium]|nr:hypothetical protein [Solirubrobacteraceae bacterium]